MASFSVMRVIFVLCFWFLLTSNVSGQAAVDVAVAYLVLPENYVLMSHRIEVEDLSSSGEGGGRGDHFYWGRLLARATSRVNRCP